MQRRRLDKSKAVLFCMLWIFAATLFTVKQTEQEANLGENLIPGTEGPAAVPAVPRIMRSPLNNAELVKSGSAAV